MKVITYPVMGKTATIRIPESYQDFHEQFIPWKNKHPEGTLFALDTETSGLEIFSEDFKIRTVQIGHGLDSWVLINDVVGFYGIQRLLSTWESPNFVLHNAAFDLLAIKQFYDCDISWDCVTDTKIMAHLVDSRAYREGGTGHSLVEVTAAYLDKDLAEDVKKSMTKLAKETKLKKSVLFAEVDHWNETYLLYAGMDVILTYGVHSVLWNKIQCISDSGIKQSTLGLLQFEHSLASACADMEARGFLLDEQYAKNLSEELSLIQATEEEKAFEKWGIEKVGSTDQVAEALIASGVKLTEKTASGKWKVDKAIMDPLIKEGNEIATTIHEAKKASKWRKTWVQKFLDTADSDGYCHANINPLQARTGRMSITGIPAQTLPSSDWRIRRCFIAEPGYSIVSCDYQAQELRVLAALSGDANMQEAFRTGADLHQLTADASGVERSVGKTVNFAYVYGSGPKNIAETCNISYDKAKEVIQGFERTYPGVKRYSDKLQREAKSKGFIVTPTGRVLKVDKERPYSALNYMIQSTSRDITASAIVRLVDQGYGSYLRLPIHDEVLACVPEEEAKLFAENIAAVMEMTFKGVHIASDADVYGVSWGGGYLNTDEDREEYNKTLKET